MIHWIYYCEYLKQVKYGDKSVDLGNEFLPAEAAYIPEVHFNHTGGILYTLALTGRVYNYFCPNLFADIREKIWLELEL